MKGKKHTSIAKITRPRISGIDRKRLFKLLDSGKKKPVIWVSAPAGSGKTTLVSSYLDARKLPYIWYQLDEGDSDTSTFFYYMGLAAKKAAPRYRTSLPLLTPEYLMGIPTFTKRYFEELFRRLPLTLSLSRKGRGEGAGGFVIVLDNYQDVNPESQFHELINNGFSAIPEGMTLIVISRAEQPPPFARLKANNKMSFIGWDEIRFTPMEAKRVIKKHSNLKLKADDVMHLYSETDGWIAGLVLLLERMQTNYASPSPIKKIPRDELFDYLAEEVFNRTDNEKQDFLLKTSFLPEISSGIAESLSGIRNASKILSELNRNQFFTNRLSQAGPVYKYHPLFREFLQARAKELFEQKEMTLIKRTAARLLKESGRIEESARLLIDAGDWTDLTELILSNAGLLMEQGRNKTLQEWIAAMPEERVRKTPWLIYWLGMCRLAYNPAEARRYFEKSFKLFENDHDLSGLYLSWASIVDTFVFEWGDFKPIDHWIAVMDSLISDTPNLPSPEIEVRVAMGMLSALTNRQPQRSDLSRWAEEVQNIIIRSHNVQLRMALGNQLIFYYMWVGDFSRIDALIDALRPSNGLKGYAPLARQNWHVMEAMYSWFAADWKTCLDAITAGLKNAEDTGVHLLDLYLVAQGVYGGLSLGDPSTAVSCLQKMALTNSQRLGDKALYHYQASSVAWYQRDFKKSEEHGRLAVRITEEMGWPFPHVLCLIELAVTLFDNGRHEDADACLSKALDLCRGVMIGLEFLACMNGARFSFDRGRDKKGFGFLNRGLTLGARYGFLNMPRWNGDVMSRLCAIALEHKIEVGYVQSLIRNRGLKPPYPVDNWPYPLKIYTLGSFSIEKDGTPIPFIGSLKVPLLMLKALIAFGGKDVETEQIIDALWPDTEGDAAHKSFEITLSRLRRLIGSDKALLLMKNRLTINPQVCWVDVTAFDHAIGRAERAWNSIEEQKNARDKHSEKTSGGALQLTRKALAVYKGHFLPFDMRQAWVMTMREHLSSKALRVIIRMGKYLEQAGSLEEALGSFEKGLEIDHLAEEIYQHLIICNHRLGRKAEAVKVYNRCRTALSVSLGITPSPKTEEIYSSILQGRS